MRRTSIWVSLVILCFLHISSRSASATIVYNQPWTGTPNGAGSAVGSQQIADDFILSSPATIRAATWMGLNTPAMGNPPPPLLGANVQFRFRFYNNVLLPPTQSIGLDHRPAVTPFAEFDVLALVTNVQAVAFPDPPSTAFAVSYAANFISPVGLSADTYWISILAEQNANFAWLLGQPGGHAVARGPGFGDGSTWFENVNADHSDYVFSLRDTTVPEPATAGLIPFVMILGCRPSCRLR